jgi:hypothetical protein
MQVCIQMKLPRCCFSAPSTFRSLAAASQSSHSSQISPAAGALWKPSIWHQTAMTDLQTHSIGRSGQDFFLLALWNSLYRHSSLASTLVRVTQQCEGGTSPS